MSRWLLAAGLYNICWGIAAVVWPDNFCERLGLYGVVYPELWQYVGVLTAVFGAAYLVAARSPLRHWPIVFAGLLASIAGTIGFLRAAFAGRLPWHFGVTLIPNNVIWWIPFTAILIRAYQKHIGRRRVTSPELQEFALRLRTNTGISLLDLSMGQPMLVYFLRHTGCPFCRESLVLLARQRAVIEAAGYAIALVHMSTDEHAHRFLSRYRLQDLPRISDPNRALYRAFGLSRANLWQLVGPHVWGRGLVSIWKYGQGLSRRGGDIFQMPGLFLLYHGHVVQSFVHQTAGDRPQFAAFVQAGNWAGNEA